MKQLQFSDGKMIGAEKYGLEEEEIKVELTPEEEKMAQSIKVTLFTIQDKSSPAEFSTSQSLLIQHFLLYP